MWSKPVLRTIANRRQALVEALSTRAVRAYAPALGVVVGQDVRCIGLPILRLEDRHAIRIGSRTLLVSRPEATALGVSRRVILRCLVPGASIEIGEDCGLSGTVICAATAVTVGARCLIGADVTIFDTDFHPLEPEGRRYAAPDWPSISAPVTIGDDVFIGTGVVIQKGVTIGDGAVIAARSVVVTDVAPRSVVGGHPAKLLRLLTERAV